MVATIAGALIAVVAAGTATGKGPSASDATKSDILSVGLTVLAFAVVTMFFVIVACIFRSRRSKGGEEEVGEDRDTRRAQLIALSCILALLVLIGVLIRLGMHSHPATHAVIGGLGTSKLPPVTKKSVPFNGSASWITAAVIGGLAALVLLPRLIGSLLLRRRFAGWRTPEREADEVLPGALFGASGLLPAERGGSMLGDPRDEPDPLRAVILAYQRFCGVMADVGRERREHETPLEFSWRLSGDPAPMPRRSIPDVVGLTALFNAARYGHKTMTPEDRERAIGYLASISALAGGALAGPSHAGPSHAGGRAGGPLLAGGPA